MSNRISSPWLAAFSAPLLGMIVAFVWVVPAWSDGPNRPDESVLLLRNGGLLQGRITRVDDRYLVELPGGEISVRAAEVQQHCRNVIEAYEVKRTLARIDSAQDHIELAQWCQKEGLPRYAADELAAAKAIDPSHPMLPLVERQIRLASQPQEPLAAPAKSAVTGPTVADLDRMIHAMPPKTVETFTQVIQPMLVSHCGAASCHGPGSAAKLQLFRPPAGSLPSRRLTQRNLYPVLEWVDRDEPGRSPLVTVPTRPHGSSRAPIFANPQNAVYGQLVDWCSRISGNQFPVIHASYEEPVGTGRNEPGTPAAARTAIRTQRNQERDAAKVDVKQRAPAFGPLSTPPANTTPPADGLPPDDDFPLSRRRGTLPAVESALAGGPGARECQTSRSICPALTASRNARLLWSNPGKAAISTGVYQATDSTSAGSGTNF